MSIRFLADADLDYAIVQGVRRHEPAIDFKSAKDAGLEGLPDDRVLEVAAGEGRVLVSHDKRTMPVHFAARIGSGRRSPGVLLALPRVPVGDIVESLLTNRLVILPSGGVGGSDSLFAVAEPARVSLISMAHTLRRLSAQEIT